MIGADHHGADIVVAQVSHQHAPGGKDGRGGGHQHPLDPQLAGQSRRVHRAAAAKGYQGELAGVVTAPHRDQLQGVDHVGIGQTDDTHGCLFNAHVEKVGDLLHGLTGLVHRDLDLAPQKVIGIDAPDHQVGISDGWFLAAGIVTGRARHRTGADRAHAQRARFVYPGDGAAASAYLHDVHRRHLDGVAFPIAPILDLVVGGDLGYAVLYQRALDRRAADVQGDDVRLVQQITDDRRADDTGHRAGLAGFDGRLAGHLKGGNTTVGLHDVLYRPHTHLAQILLQGVEVMDSDRLDVGVEHGSIGALVLSPLPRDLVGEGDGNIRQQLSQKRATACFVVWVGIGVQEANSDGFYSLFLEELCRLAHIVLVQRLKFLSLVIDPLPHLQPQVTRHKGHRLGIVQVVDVGTVGTGDL